MPPEAGAVTGAEAEAVAGQVFVALADPSRRAILAELASAGPATATDLAARLPITRQAITKHLYTMADAGLLRSRREGRESLWEVRPERLEDARHSLELISKQWDHSLARLKKLVEE